jgi:hypothetical protein
VLARAIFFQKLLFTGTNDITTSEKRVSSGQPKVKSHSMLVEKRISDNYFHQRCGHKYLLNQRYHFSERTMKLRYAHAAITSYQNK